MSKLGYFGEVFNDTPYTYCNASQRFKNSPYYNPTVRLRDTNHVDQMTACIDTTPQYGYTYPVYGLDPMSNGQTINSATPQQEMLSSYYNYDNYNMNIKNESTTWIMKPRKNLRKSTTSLPVRKPFPQAPGAYMPTNHAFPLHYSQFWNYANLKQYNVTGENGVLYANYETPLRPGMSGRKRNMNTNINTAENYRTYYKTAQGDRSTNMYIYNYATGDTENLQYDYNKFTEVIAGNINHMSSPRNNETSNRYTYDCATNTAEDESRAYHYNKFSEAPAQNVNKNSSPINKSNETPNRYTYDCATNTAEDESRGYNNHNKFSEVPAQNVNKMPSPINRNTETPNRYTYDCATNTTEDQSTTYNKYGQAAGEDDNISSNTSNNGLTKEVITCDCLYESPETNLSTDSDYLTNNYFENRPHRNFNNTVNTPKQRNIGKFYTFKKPSYNCKFSYPSGHKCTKKLREQIQLSNKIRVNSTQLNNEKNLYPINEPMYNNESHKQESDLSEQRPEVTVDQCSLAVFPKFQLSEEELRELRACEWHQFRNMWTTIRAYHSADDLPSNYRNRIDDQRNSLPTFTPDEFNTNNPFWDIKNNPKFEHANARVQPQYAPQNIRNSKTPKTNPKNDFNVVGNTKANNVNPLKKVNPNGDTSECVILLKDASVEQHVIPENDLLDMRLNVLPFEKVTNKEFSRNFEVNNNFRDNFYKPSTSKKFPNKGYQLKNVSPEYLKSLRF